MKIRNYSLGNIIQNFLLRPATAGLYGFTVFFTIIIFSKYLGVLIGNYKVWHVDISDVALSLLGFVFMFLINFLKHFQKFQSSEPGKNKNGITV